jgi:hypothetical protein
MKNLEMDQLETAIITRNDHGFEVSDSFGEIIGNYRNWGQVAAMFREHDFSEEYIAKRKRDLERSSQTTIDESNE